MNETITRKKKYTINVYKDAETKEKLEIKFNVRIWEI